MNTFLTFHTLANNLFLPQRQANWIRGAIQPAHILWRVEGKQGRENLIQRYIFQLKKMEAPLVKISKCDTISGILDLYQSKVRVVVF